MSKKKKPSSVHVRAADLLAVAESALEDRGPEALVFVHFVPGRKRLGLVISDRQLSMAACKKNI